MKCCSYKYRKTYSRKPIGIFQFPPSSTVPTVVRLKPLSLESEEYVLWDFNLYLHNHMQNMMKNTYFKGKTAIASSCTDLYRETHKKKILGQNRWHTVCCCHGNRASTSTIRLRWSCECVLTNHKKLHTWSVAHTNIGKHTPGNPLAYFSFHPVQLYPLWWDLSPYPWKVKSMFYEILTFIFIIICRT